MSEAKAREAICLAGERMFARGLVHGTSGNISVRVEDGWIMTPTNARLNTLDPARLSKVGRNLQLISGDPPSKESTLHVAIYERQPQTRAVVHTHSPYSVAVSCMEHDRDEDVLPILTAYYVMRVGRLKMVPYFRPGDAALAAAVGEAATTHKSLLMANHGPILAGRSMDEALYALEELEETARLFMLLRGIPARTLGPAEVQELYDSFDIYG